jgi:LysM repeat protein
MTALILVPVILILGTYAYYQYFGLILPGVHVRNTTLTGLTLQEAAIELQKTWNLENQISATDGMQSWALTPDEIGLHLDPLQTAQLAYRVGHGQSVMAELAQMLYSLMNGWPIEPVVYFDVEAASDRLEIINLGISVSPQDAYLYFDGESFVAVPPELGYEVNIEETLTTLVADPTRVLFEGELFILLKPVPPQVTDVSASLSEAHRLLDNPVIVSAYDPISDEHFQWTIERNVVGSWLTFLPGMDGPIIGVDGQLVADFINAMENSLGEGVWLEVQRSDTELANEIMDGVPINAHVRHQPTTYIVQPGDTLLKIGWNVGVPFWMILNANPGLDPDHLLAGQELTIPSKDELLPLPVVPGKRIVISISKQRLWVYENGESIGKYKISTGIDRSPTQPGVFQVQTHDRKAYASVWDLTMPHFLGIYEAWPGFMNGIHGLPTLSSGRRLWGNILGRPASYGCIILDLDNAKRLYNWAEDGVVVEITP